MRLSLFLRLFYEIWHVHSLATAGNRAGVYESRFFDVRMTIRNEMTGCVPNRKRLEILQ